MFTIQPREYIITQKEDIVYRCGSQIHTKGYGRANRCINHKKALYVSQQQFISNIYNASTREWIVYIQYEHIDHKYRNLDT